MTEDPHLRAYRAAHYEVQPPEGAAIRLVVDQHAPELDAWISRLGYTCACLVTAHNPASRLQPMSVNEEAQRGLEADLRLRGVDAWPGWGGAPDGTWPPEASVLALGLSLADGVRLGRRWGQRAILYVERGARVALIDCGTPVEPR